MAGTLYANLCVTRKIDAKYFSFLPTLASEVWPRLLTPGSKHGPLGSCPFLSPSFSSQTYSWTDVLYLHKVWMFHITLHWYVFWTKILSLGPHFSLFFIYTAVHFDFNFPLYVCLFLFLFFFLFLSYSLSPFLWRVDWGLKILFF